MTDVELAKLVIGSGNKQFGVEQIAEQLVANMVGNKIGLDELTAIDGISTAKSAGLVGAFELYRRTRVTGRATRLDTPEKVQLVVSELLHKNKENLVVLTINAAWELVGKHLVSVGTLSETIVHPRDIFYPAIIDNAAGIVLVHNHPSGKAFPSNVDLEVTQHLLEAARILDIRLIDHVIVAKRQAPYSMRDNGQI